MSKTQSFFRTMKSAEEAVEFANKVGGTVVEGCTVNFQADYSISKALYNVKANAYKVFIRIRPEGADPLTYAVYAKTSKEAYTKAREKVEKRYL